MSAAQEQESRRDVELDAPEEQFLELAPLRAQLYTFLTAAFVRSPEFRDAERAAANAFLEIADMFNETTAAALRRMAGCLQSSRERRDEVREEFMNLFKVPGAQYVPPYESVYRDSRDADGRIVKGLLAGPSSIDVRRWYRLAAVEVSPEFRDLSDHVALELNFMGHLCQKELDFSMTGDVRRLRRAWEIERDFLFMHLVSWCGMFRNKIHEKTRHPYYHAVSDLTAEFTKYDFDTLAGLNGAPQKGQWEK